MVSPTQVASGRIRAYPAVDQQIVVTYDPITYAVTVTPDTIKKGSVVCFTCPQAAVRVVFVSPFSDDTVQLLDSEPRKLTVGGVFHFRCFFTEKGEPETEGTTGGILDIQPNRP